MDVVHQGRKLAQIKFPMKAHRPSIQLTPNKLAPHKNCRPLQLEDTRMESIIVLESRKIESGYARLTLAIITFVGGKILRDVTNEYYDVRGT